MKEVKDSDASVAKLQTLSLDAVAPLVHGTEEGEVEHINVPKDGGQRPVINLKSLNRFVTTCTLSSLGHFVSLTIENG